MLSGIRILDLSRVLAGPLCTMILGDLGADVIKIERPGTGDSTRGWGPPFDDRGESAYFLSINRNKASVAADLSTSEGQRLVAGLMDEADVVVENFLPGALARCGLAPEVMCGRYPRLVWCTISGFGAESTRPGYDFVVQAEQGWMSITGERDGSPMKAGVALADVVTGKDAAIAVLAALVARGRTGAGAHVRVSLAQSAAAALINAGQNVLVGGGDAGRWGNAHPNLVPYQLFAAADRDVVVAVGTDDQWAALVRVLGVPPLSEAAYATNAGRVAARGTIILLVARAIRERPAADWRTVLDAAGVPNGVVRTVREVLADPATGASALTGIAPSVPGRVRRPPPGLDEDGEGIRARGWGYFTRD
ncbi:MAG: CoA transferase [Gemmatimonadaceae bacterium]|nr:CoA transferase [Gemmatimonadaceae bacterium]